MVVLSLEPQPYGNFDSEAFLQLWAVGPLHPALGAGPGALEIQKSGTPPPRPREPILVGVGRPTGQNTVCPFHLGSEHP